MGAPQVLIVGAGPTGLFLAYILKRQGVNFRIIDQKPGPSDQSRAIGIHARTLEFYRFFGLDQHIVPLGLPADEAVFAVNGTERARFSFKDMGQGISHFPYMLDLTQDVHERLLVAQLKTLGVEVEWQHKLISLEQNKDRVTAILQNPDGNFETANFDYLAGCDGGSSLTRRLSGINFSGGTTHGLFFVADVAAKPESQYIKLGITKERLFAMFVARHGVQRIIGMLPDDAENAAHVSFDEVSAPAAAALGLTIEKLNWFASYHVHHRVADRFRAGRCFLLGDAGHIHSPVGGQGMNTGLGDAMNLGWKLAEVVKGEAPATILETYEPERIAFARKLVATTDRAFEIIMAHGAVARFVRLHVIWRLARFLSRFNISRKLMFRTVSQTAITYRGSSVSQGQSGALAGGDRLPWLARVDNYAKIDGLKWQIHAFGQLHPGLAETAIEIDLNLQTFSFSQAAQAAGFRDGSVYLIRPDGYLGLVQPQFNAAELKAYLAQLRSR